MQYSDWSKDDLIQEIERIKEIRYGLVWHKDLEEHAATELLGTKNPNSRHEKESPQERFFPVIKNNDNPINAGESVCTDILIQGDNYHALGVLNFTHQESIDVIYIDPPYNTGETDFKYNDKWVSQEDGFKHSKWLSFMEKRLILARSLLSDTGVLISHIDEHEVENLSLLLSDIFGEANNLGTIIWNKANPKGDSKGVSVQHEFVLCFAKNKSAFLQMENVLKRRKPNAEAMLAKAAALIAKKGKKAVPENVAAALRSCNYPKKMFSEFEVTYTLEHINREFQAWLANSGFSGGEKAYKFINNRGEVYRGTPMTWPSKKTKAPPQYFEPLYHPVTKKKCPVPARGWRYPPETMKRLLSEGHLLFGSDESKQPEKLSLLKDRVLENTPSLYKYAASDDDLFKTLELDFEYAKPLSVAKYFLSAIHPNPKVVLDFFAGSGTAGHAVAALRKENEGFAAQYILCTNDENAICSEICYPRLQKVMHGVEPKIKPLGGSLIHYSTYLISAASTDANRLALVEQSTEMLCLKENAFVPVIEKEHMKVFEGRGLYLGILFDEDRMKEFKEAIRSIPGTVHIYVFSLGDDNFEEEFEEFKGRVRVCSVPEGIICIYRDIFG